ncbi:MAG: hypothetical protein QOG23_3874 [Blastocatellia bacterium]|jgi:tetratricopeptide (TPR) repeat protein|nr:hypothetical protein [Blastocatellia bacterium]
MPAEPPNSVEVFYSYAHEDEKLRDELKKHLSNLKRQGVITDWYDRDISAGKEWDDEIKQHLDSARVILLLISPDFMDSDYIHDVEVKRALERHVLGEASVIPVILRPVDWQGAPFSKLQGLPTDAKPVTSWDDRDEAFLEITKGIRKAIQELSGPTTSVPRVPDIPRPPKVGFVSRRDKDGRDIVERLRVELAPEKNQLVALWGAGGVGKTTLAAEAVRALAETYGQRVIWVSADARPNFAFSTLLDDIADQLGHSELRPLAVDRKEEALRPLIRAKPTLIVLDNLETIALEEKLRSQEFLAKQMQCPALITTRERVNNAHLIPLTTMSPDEASEFLDKLISQTHDADGYEEVIRKRLLSTAEFNPLIIRWIVAQIDLAQDPEEVLSDLAEGEGEAAQRVFHRSFNLPQMANGGRAVLLALSLFVPSATRKALAEVSGLNKQNDRRRFRDAVRTLSSLWLLRTREAGERLAVEGLTRELTIAQLLHDPRSKTFRQRYVTRFLHYAEAHTQPTSQDYEFLETEKENVVLAAELAMTRDSWKTAATLVSIIAAPENGMLEIRGYWDDVTKLNEQALAASRQWGSNLDVAVFAHNLAMMLGSRGRLDEARKLYEESLGIDEKLGNARGIASSLHQLAMLAQNRGDFEEARHLYIQSLQIDRKAGHKSGIATSLHQLGTLALEQGELVEARRFFDESLEMKEGLNDQLGIAASLQGLASVAEDEGDLENARRLYGESLEITRTLGSQLGIAVSLYSFANLAAGQRDVNSARRFCSESLEIDRRLGNQMGIAKCLWLLGTLAEAESNNLEAATFFREALTIFERLESPDADVAREALERTRGN